MGKQIVCDFCGSSADRKIHVRGKYWQWIPAMFSPYTAKLWLCYECHKNLIEVVVERQPKEGKS